MTRKPTKKALEAEQYYLSKQGNVSIEEISTMFSVTQNTVRTWKSKFKWNDKLALTSKKKENKKEGSIILDTVDSIALVSEFIYDIKELIEKDGNYYYIDKKGKKHEVTSSNIAKIRDINQLLLTFKELKEIEMEEYKLELNKNKFEFQKYKTEIELQIKKDKLDIEKAKVTDEDDEIEDDGFIDALKGHVSEVWEDEDTEED